VVAKFYRPGRWSSAAILEEHAFSIELSNQEIPVVAPCPNSDGTTLHEHSGFLFAVYPRCGGRWPDLDTREQRRQMGRFLGRMHAVGAVGRFEHRGKLDIDTLGRSARAFVLDRHLVPDYLLPAYTSLSTELLEHIQARFDAVGPIRQIRLHGDCHPGNILWTDTGPHFVDLDDSSTGPACDFDYSGVLLIEALRTLRIMNYTAWIARRWEDPAFPLAFPWFDSPRYWEEHILSLREQAAALNQPPVL
jgi:Ser/Thr protein kinase RdoA (MazF antagonist)